MRPALHLSKTTSRTKSNQCVFRACRSARPRLFPSMTLPQPNQPLFFLFRGNRWMSTEAMPSPVLDDNNKIQNDTAHRPFKLHPRHFNKDLNLDSLLSHLASHPMSPKKKIFKSLHSALYNAIQYDPVKAWTIFEAMLEYKVDSYLKPNHYGHLLGILKYSDSPGTIPRMLQVLDHIQSSPHPLTGYHLSQVLFAMSRQGQAREAYQLMQAHTTLPLTANHYHSLAVALKYALKHRTDHLLLEQVTKFMLDGMQQTTLNHATLATMISLLAGSHTQHQRTLDFLNALTQPETKTQQKEPYNVYIYTSLIAGFARRGDTKSAQQLFDQMVHHKVKPTQVTYAALIEAYGRAGDFKTAQDLLDRFEQKFRKPNAVMYTSLLVNAIRHQHPIAYTLEEQINQRLKPHEIDTMLRTALLWLSTKRNLDQARATYESLPAHQVHPIMLHHLLSAYGQRGDKANALQTYHALVHPTDRSKHLLSRALFHCRDVPAALDVFLQSSLPDEITCAMVIQGLIMNKEADLAWRLFRSFQQQGIEPSLRAYSSMLKGLGHYDTLQHKQKKMTNDQVTTEAWGLFRRLTGFREPHVYTYTALIACFAKRDLNRAISIFDHMCSQQVQPTVETYTALLQGCAIFRNSQMALNVFHHMCSRQIEPNAVTWRYLLKSLLRSRVDKQHIDQLGAIARKSMQK